LAAAEAIRIRHGCPSADFEAFQPVVRIRNSAGAFSVVLDPTTHASDNPASASSRRRASERRSKVLIGLAIVVAVIALWAIGIFNGLVGLKNQVQNAWKQIDVQLKRRHDLIPNLVNTVKGMMKFEQETLTKVMEARAKAISARTVGEKGAAESELTGSLARLLAVFENYPDLKSNQNVLQLQEELTTTENQIGFSRQHYNDLVMRFNTQQQTFPANLIAGMLGFTPAEFLEIAATEREVPRVDLSTA
jgi:LemA protein